jgi:DNA-binding transcriptional regulator LsrR (DeoR family)
MKYFTSIIKIYTHFIDSLEGLSLLDQSESNDDLALRAAWLHYVGGMTQAEVAAHLGVSNVKAHRLVAQANQSGAIKVTIDGDISKCAALEVSLTEMFGLDLCHVAPDLNEDGLPLRTLGVAGARFFQHEIQKHAGRVIGVGHGRTLAAAVRALPRMGSSDVQFVSLLGGVTRNFAANPHDVMYRLADRTGATAYVMPVPLFANSAADRGVLLAQRGVRDVLDLAISSDLKIVGIGTTQHDAQLITSQLIGSSDLEEVRRSGGVGELLGHFFDHAGQPLNTMLSDRTVSPDLSALKGRRIIAIAGGAEKVNAIRSVLRSGHLSGLVTDETTARALMKEGL